MKRRKAPMSLVLEQNWRFDKRASVAEVQERIRKTGPAAKTPVSASSRAN